MNKPFLSLPITHSMPEKRARFLFRVRSEKACADDEQLAATQSHGVLSQRRYMEITGNRVVAALAGTENFNHVEKDDFVISLRTFEGGIERAAESGCISPAYTVLAPSREVEPKFFHYLLKSQVFISHLQTTVTGIRDGKSVKFENFANIVLPTPDLATQRQIADFLDRETARIDLLIEKKQRLVALLGEKYKAEENRLVFDLDNDPVERSASTVSWLPNLPRHWHFMRCAHIFNNLDHRRIPLSSEQRGDLAKIYPYYGASGIIDAVDDYLFDEDAILVGEDGANLVMQSSPIAFRASGKYWVNNHAHILTPRFGVFDYWIHALNQVPYEVFVTGSAQPKLTSAVLGNIRLPVPPSHEQSDIASRIETMGHIVNSAIEPIRASIDRLKEYRSALITAAVTGQIEVTTYTKSGSADRRLDAIQEEMGA